MPSSISDREAIDLIFLPGFSTTEMISDISGRGVGMDVVRNNIASVSGMIDIETRQGTGFALHHHPADHTGNHQGPDYQVRR